MGIENMLGALVWTLHDRLRSELEATLGIGGEAGAAVVTVYHEAGLSVERLSRIIGLTQPAAVRLVDVLVDRGLIERRKGKDKRTLALHLTTAGERVAGSLLGTRHDVIARVLRDLNANERTQLATLLERVLSTSVRDQHDLYGICRLCDERSCSPNGCPVRRGVEAIGTVGA